MGISSYYFKNIEAKLIRNDYWDFFLNGDNQGCKVDYATKCLDKYGYEAVTDGLVLWFYVNESGTTTNGTSLISLTEWDGVTIKPSSGITLCDFGLTGVDNGRYDQLSGITVNITSADTKMILYPVTGYTINSITGTATSGKYSYDWSYISGSTTNGGCPVGSTICLDGGFYQGYFKLDFLEPTPILQSITSTTCPNEVTTTLIGGDPNATQYQLLPTEYPNGWSMETWLKWDNSNCASGHTGTTINDDFSGNTNFFFYIGTRAENKFRNVFSGETGLTTCGGIPLPPDVEYTVSDGTESWFTKSGYYGKSCRCGFNCTGNTVTTATTETYCDQLSENALGFRITPDGRIGYRKMTVTTGCYNNKERITGTTMEEGYSELPVMLTGNNWTHIVVTYKQNNVKHGLPSGTLRFWVNGRVVYRVENFIGIQLRALDEWSDKQLGVPFNMSWGGGTQGLLESQTFGGPDPEDQNLDIATNFAGTFDGELSQLRFYEKALNLLEIRNNLYVDCPRYCVRETYGGALIVQPSLTFCDENCRKTNNLITSDTLGLLIDLSVEFSFGSIIIKYTADIHKPLLKDLNLKFKSNIPMKDGTTTVVNPEIFIRKGTTVGTTTITINDDYSKLAGHHEITDFEYVSEENLSIRKTDKIMFKTPLITDGGGNTGGGGNTDGGGNTGGGGNTDTGTTNTTLIVYYGKLTEQIFDPEKLNELNIKQTNKIIDSYLNLEEKYGYGYILIPKEMAQPTLFRNSNEGCAGFAIPMIDMGEIILDNNGSNGANQNIYIVYRTYVSTHANVDVWLCD